MKSYRLNLAYSESVVPAQLKSHLSLYALCYAEACNELTGSISAPLNPYNTAPFEESRSGGNTVSDLTCPRFEAMSSICN